MGCKGKKPSSLRHNSPISPHRPQTKGTLKLCRYCHVKLGVGINWTESRKNKHDYICRECKSKSKKGLTPKIKKLKAKTSSGVPTCPKCSAKMEKRKSIYGYFWGCSKFFENGCKGTRKI